MKMPRKCLVDTNVPKVANLAIQQQDKMSDISNNCILSCVEAIEYVIKKRYLVIDDGDEIFDEYRKQLSMKGQPGVGDKFMKWVHDNRYNLPEDQRVIISKEGDSYKEFPKHIGLDNFDLSDRKFIAVANAHGEKPPILQATDSKWWGWKDSLEEAGIKVCFLCSDYVKEKFEKKIGT